MVLDFAFVPWVMLGVIVVVIGVGIVLGLRRSRRQRAQAGAPLARAERLRNMPSFARAIKRRRVALAAALALGVIAMGVGGIAAARPMAAQTIQPVNTSRDIMLCLDVSGSMAEVDMEILDTFLELTDDFKGERIGLTIFNASPVQVFPLTDDYEFVKEHLKSLRDSFESWDAMPEYWVGTMNGAGSSLIGDGLTACAMRFDHEDEDRSRSIIFASDNEELGDSIVTLPEAAAYASSKGVRIFAINPVAGASTLLTEEMRAAAASTGGEMYELRGTTTVADIVDRVQEEDASALQGDVQIVWTDDPNLWITLLAGFAVAFLLVLWRVKL